MTLKDFFKTFDLFADAPNAVAKMRTLILEFGMTGRLLRKESEWRQVPLKALTTKIGSGATPAGGRESYHSEGIPLIRSMNVHFSGFEPKGLVFLNKKQADELANVIVRPDDVLLNITGASIGRVTLAPFDMAGARVNQHVTIIRSTAEILPKFLALFLASPSIQTHINKIQVGATRQALTKGMIERFEIPVPSVKEQKRIVAKVDELMTLCDQLEAQQQERETKHAALTRAAVARFSAVPTPANLNLLFHKSYTIPPADLRKTILTLAVRGKLVSQNPQDLPATVAFPKLAISKISAGIREVPAGWFKIPLGKVGTWRGGGTPSKARPDFWKGDVPWVSPKDMKVFRISDAEDHISKSAVENSSVVIIPKGSLLMVVRGMILARAFPVAIAAREVTINQDMKAVVPFYPEILEFLLLALRALECEALSLIARSTHGTCKFETQHLHSLAIAIPPLAEQRRIVAKVDELMALVDALEKQLTASRTKAAQLMDAVVAELTTA